MGTTVLHRWSVSPSSSSTILSLAIMSAVEDARQATRELASTELPGRMGCSQITHSVGLLGRLRQLSKARSVPMATVMRLYPKAGGSSKGRMASPLVTLTSPRRRDQDQGGQSGQGIEGGIHIQHERGSRVIGQQASHRLAEQ